MNNEQTHWTFLTKRNKRWRRMPPEIQNDLLQGVAKVKRIRAQIAADAAVKAMPPIEVLDEIWISADGKSVINGRAAPVIIKGKTWFGAQLAAPTILLQDDALIRGILVHEYAHCFFMISQAINAKDAGFSHGELRMRPDGDNSPLDRAQDDAMLVNPAEWFGPADAKALMHWDDARWDDEHQEDGAQIIIKLRPWLPVKTPQLNFKIQGITYDVEVANHIRTLRDLDGNR